MKMKTKKPSPTQGRGVKRLRGTTLICRHLTMPALASAQTCPRGYRNSQERKGRCILADNGADRRDLQVPGGPSACDFEVIFNTCAALVSQLPQLSVAVVRVYSSSTASSACYGKASIVAVPDCFQQFSSNKKPLHLRGFSNIASSPHLAATSRVPPELAPFLAALRGGLSGFTGPVPPPILMRADMIHISG